MTTKDEMELRERIISNVLAFAAGYSSATIARDPISFAKKIEEYIKNGK